MQEVGDFRRIQGSGYDEHGFVADFYDHVVPYRARRDVDFFVETAIASGGPVLEVGCGTGRVLVPTARAGIDIVGLDLSGRMLDVCRQRLAGEVPDVQSRVSLECADMRDFNLDRTFALATFPFRPFQHLITVRDQMSCLQAIRRHLVKGGRLILDLFNPSHEALVRNNLGQEFGEEPEFRMPDGRRVTRRHRIASRDLADQIIQAELIYDVSHPDGRPERLVHAFPMRYLFRYEVEHLLTCCGFAIEAIYADYDRSPFGSKYPGELIAVATNQ